MEREKEKKNGGREVMVELNCKAETKCWTPDFPILLLKYCAPSCPIRLICRSREMRVWGRCSGKGRKRAAIGYFFRQILSWNFFYFFSKRKFETNGRKG
jgi:hypothetical protein